MYPCYESIKQFARKKLKAQLGAHVKIRFTNRDGKFYVQVIDEQSGLFDNATMNAVKQIVDTSGGVHTNLTSAGRGSYTFRFHAQDHRE